MEDIFRLLTKYTEVIVDLWYQGPNCDSALSIFSDFNDLSKLKKLKTLNLAYNWMDMEILKALGALPTLRSLFLEGQEIDDKGTLDDKGT